MAKARNENLTWQDVDTAGFKGPLAKAYKAMKDAQAVSRDAARDFDDAFRKAAGAKFGEGNSCLISHRFGKMAIAVVPEDAVQQEKKKGNGEKFAL